MWCPKLSPKRKGQSFFRSGYKVKKVRQTDQNRHSTLTELGLWKVWTRDRGKENIYEGGDEEN